MSGLNDLLDALTAPVETITKLAGTNTHGPRMYAKHYNIAEIKLNKFYTTSTSPPGLNLTWSVDNEEGAVNWTISNNTNQTVSVGLYRGVPNYSPIYFFGGAFNMVYLANNMVSPCTSIEQEFCLGIYSFLGMMKFPAFVFNLRPQSGVSIKEYGFPPNPQIIAALVPLRPLKQVNALVYYDPNLPQEYMQITGLRVPYEPDPYSIASLVYEMPQNYPNIFNYLVVINTPLTRSPLLKSVYLSLLNTKIGSLILSKI